MILQVQKGGRRSRIAFFPAGGWESGPFTGVAVTVSHQRVAVLCCLLPKAYLFHFLVLFFLSFSLVLYFFFNALSLFSVTQYTYAQTDTHTHTRAQ